MKVSQDSTKRKTTVPIYTDTIEFLDGLREVYPDGNKESWDYFLMRIGKFYMEHRKEASV
ncbi:MAG: hypothetical protein QXU98_07265 [Candidatus Parvarchaeota archaeon]